MLDIADLFLRLRVDSAPAYCITRRYWHTFNGFVNSTGMWIYLLIQDCKFVYVRPAVRRPFYTWHASDLDHVS